MSDFRIDQITNQAGTAGPQIAGITTFSGSSGLLMPSGDTFRRNNFNEQISLDGLFLFYDVSYQESYTEGSNTIRDLTGLSPDGIINGNPSYSNTYGGELSLDGADDWIQVYTKSQSNTLINTNNGTIEIWYSVENTTGFVFQYFSANNDRLYYDAAGSSFAIGDTGKDPTFDFESNKLYCFQASWDGSYVKTYLNGVKLREDRNWFSNPGFTFGGTEKYYIGRGWDSNPVKMTGKFYRHLIYNRTLSEEEVFQNFNAVKGRYGL